MENCGIAALCQETVGEWITKLGFKYDYDVNNDYVGGHEKKDAVWYEWKYIDFCLLLE